MNRQETGGTFGIRHLFGDHFTTSRLHVRYTGVGDADLTTGILRQRYADRRWVRYWELVRGFSLVADFESGEFSSLVGRISDLDLDED